MKIIRIGLIGNYGWNNFGDELLLNLFYKYIKKSGFDVVIYSQNPIISQSKYKDSKVYNCAGIRSLFNIKTLISLSRIDALIFGGGGIINDYYHQTPKWVKSWHSVARILGTPVLYLSVGVSMLSSKKSINTYRKVINTAHFFSVRDKKSKDIISDYYKKEVHLSTDAVFLLDKKQSSASNRNTILISLRDWPFESNFELFLMNFGQSLKHFVEYSNEEKIKLKLVSFENNDKYVLTRLYNYTGKNIDIEFIDINNRDDFASIYQDVIFTVGMRFHSLVLSSFYSVPFIGLNYDSKVSSLTDKFMGEKFVFNFDFSVETMYRTIIDLFENNLMFKSKIMDLVACEQETISNDMKNIVEILRNI